MDMADQQRPGVYIHFYDGLDKISGSCLALNRLQRPHVGISRLTKNESGL